MNKKLVTVLSLFLVFSLSSQAAQSKILMILADDFSRDWISAYGSANKTPAIDKLAANGLRFTTAWQTSTDKKKAEKNFLTGSYKGTGLPFPSRLIKAGYRTYYLGTVNSGALLKTSTSIKQAGFQHYSLNSGALQNIEMKGSLAQSVIGIMKKKQKSFVCVRFAAKSLKSKADYAKHAASIDKFVAEIGALTKASTPVTIILTSVSGSKIHETMKMSLDKKVTRNPFANNKKFKKETFVAKDIDLRLPLIVKSPLVPEAGLYTKDLIDATDFAPTLADLAGLKPLEKGNSKSFKPALTGDLNPLIKKNWIFCDAGKEKLIRSWHYVYYTSDRIYGLNFDPNQNMNLLIGKNNDKHYVGERVRLKMIYEREFLGIQPKKESLVKVETLEK